MSTYFPPLPVLCSSNTDCSMFIECVLHPLCVSDCHPFCLGCLCLNPLCLILTVPPKPKLSVTSRMDPCTDSMMISSLSPLNPSPLGWLPQTVKNLPAMSETWVQYLGWEDPLEEGLATHSSILAWRIPTDRGAWLARVHGATKSQTQLNDKTQHNISVYSLPVPGNLSQFLPYIHSKRY